MKKIAVVFFPGMNCEVESLRALCRNGLDAEIVRWNEDKSVLDKFDGVLIPGGFSFEDRGRSGIVSSKEPILDKIRQMVDQSKPVIGICNGAQVLVEGGLVPSITDGVDMSLARNKRISVEEEVLGTGFYHDWVYIKNTADKKRTPFNNFDQVIKVPIAHGEGRFIASDSVIDYLNQNDMRIFTYVDHSGNAIDQFPINPNGSVLNLAGVSNVYGNVLAMMPHPERTENGDVIFESLAKWFEDGKVYLSAKPELNFEDRQGAVRKNYDIEFYVELKITDNTCKTIERALAKTTKKDAKLSRRLFWGVNVSGDLHDLAFQMANSGELYNVNKENCVIKIADKYYKVVENALEEIEFALSDSFIAFDKEDFIGQEKQEKLAHHLSIKDVQVRYGVVWGFSGVSFEEVSESCIFTNPVAGYLVRQ
jgi:phosphoribosylformylglycinamidine synthase